MTADEFLDTPPAATPQPPANPFDKFDGNAFDRFDGPDLLANILHPPVFAESTGGGTLNIPGDLLNAKFPPHQWTPQEIAQEQKDEDAVDAQTHPGLIGTLPRAVVADTAAEMMSAFDSGNRTQDADMFSGNIPAALEGNALPIDQIIKQEAADKDEIPAVTAAKISTGIANSAPWLATGFLGLPAWAGRLMALGFSGQMISDAGPAARTLGTELGKNPEDRDSDAISSAVSDLVQDFGFAPFSGLHGARDLIEPYVDRRMYIIRQLSDQLQNGPMIPPAFAPNLEEDSPAQGGPDKQQPQQPPKSDSEKLDDLAAMVKGLHDMVRGKLFPQAQPVVDEPTDGTVAGGTSQPAQGTVPPGIGDFEFSRSLFGNAESVPGPATATPHYVYGKDGIGGLDDQTVQAGVQNYLRRQNNVPPVQIVNDPTWTHNGYGVRGTVKDGKIIVNRAFIDSAGTLQKVLREEHNHVLLSSEAGRQAIRNGIGSNLGLDQLAPLSLKYRIQPGESVPDYRARLTDEFIAKAASEQLPIWQRIVERVKGWLADRGSEN
ncbi:MAG TPA: hypothetical protein VMF08_05960 [Candidatus Sulfotelmatobacter sp.]|nr:hypothetical protein [Candidatus Sulfotelmatobacter sp.]